MFEQLTSKEVYRGKLLHIALEEVRYPDGRVRTFDVVNHPGAVTILPVDEYGKIWFVKQYRQGARSLILELPAGTIEPGEEPVDCAGRELQEEIGMKATKLEPLGDCYMVPGYSTERMYFFLGTGLEPESLKPDDREYIRPIEYSIAEVRQALNQGQIKDAKTLAALLLARGRIRLWEEE